MAVTRLELEVEDFVAASGTVYRDVADPVRVAVGRLADVLHGCGAMAGDDPAGSDWARDYDEAARATLQATASAVNGAYRLSAMFARSGLNYAEADAASTPATQRGITADIRQLPPESSVGPAAPVPSARGGSGDTPTGWRLVAHLVGYVWPNGHQDRLHRAAAAWTASAEALQDAGDYAVLAPIGFAADRLPELDDMQAVCDGLGRQLRDLAHAHRSLARACTGLAAHIDECHSAIGDELRSFIEWSAGIQAVGGLVSIVSFGLAEAPTQAAQGAKLAATAAKVGELIAAFTAAARALAETLPAVASIADRVSLTLDRLRNARLAVAGMSAVPELPRVARIGRVSEVAAERRLAGEASMSASRAGGVAGAGRNGDGGIPGATSRVGRLSIRFGAPVAKIRQAIHTVKDEARFPNNPDMVVDEFGEVYPLGRNGSAGDSIGNILDYLGDL